MSDDIRQPIEYHRVCDACGADEPAPFSPDWVRLSFKYLMGQIDLPLEPALIDQAVMDVCATCIETGREAARRHAAAVLATQATVELPPDSIERMLTLVRNPAEPSPRLRAAARRHLKDEGR